MLVDTACRVYTRTTFVFLCVFSGLGGIFPLQSDWSLSCDHGLDHASYCQSNTTTSNDVFLSARTCHIEEAETQRGS